MNQSYDFSTERMVEEFNRQLETMAAYQQQACTRVIFQRLAADLQAMNRPQQPAKSLSAQVKSWLVGQLLTQLQKLNTAQVASAEDGVIVIDVPYRVMASGKPQESKTLKERNQRHGTDHAIRCE